MEEVRNHMPTKVTDSLEAQPHRVHLIAVCGTAMGALACMLKEMGYEVSGSDKNIYPPMSLFLKERNIPVHEGFSPSNLNCKPDLVVVGNAVSRDNPEVEAMQSLELPFMSMPQAVNRFAAQHRKQIVVTGTHGKTTTSAFLAWLLSTAGLDPSFLIGGILSNFNSNYRVGRGDWIVLEGDEYDTAFFDKGPKFLHYTPAIAVLTSVEFDHADIYTDLEHVKSAFSDLLQRLADDALLIAFERDPNVAGLLDRSSCPVILYGGAVPAGWRIGSVQIEPPVTRFEVFYRNQLFAKFETGIIGEHNLCNLLSGIAVGHAIGIDKTDMAKALSTFKGVRRRQEIRGSENDIVVIDDFAHHPTAVAATVKAVKAFYEHNRLIAVFEPRTNSSRRKVFQHIYPEAFEGADLVCIRQAPLLEKIPKDQRFSSSQLVADLKAVGHDAIFFQDTESLIDFLAERARPRDVILIMSNGGFDNIHMRLLDRLRSSNA